MTRMSRREFVGSSAALAGAGLIAPLAGRLLEAAPVLQKRTLGKTGFQATVVGFGGGARFYQPELGDENAAELLRHMIDRGGNLVETSANYGPNGESEKRIGLAMKTHRAKVFLETKVDARDYDGAMREMERSLQRMNTDHLDLVLHHNLSNQKQLDELSAENGAERAIRKMIDQKAVRFHGFSSHVPSLAIEAITRLDPDAIQLIVNATRLPDMESDVLPLCRSRNIGVIAMKTCGHGFFFKNWATKPDRFDQYGPPAGVLDRPNLPTPRDYLHYALSLPITVAVVGIDAVSTADAVVDTALAFKPLAFAEMKSISERAQVFTTTGYWIPRQRPAPSEAD